MRSFAIFLAVAVAWGCQQEAASPPAVVHAPAMPATVDAKPTPPQPAIDVALDFTMEVTDGRGFVRGSTNLPDEASVTATIDDRPTRGQFFTSSIHCTVSAGHFQAGPFSQRGETIAGEYIVEVLMPVPQVQPENVRSIIGARGERLRGPLVEQTTDSVVVTLQKVITFGDQQGRASQEAGLAKMTAALEQAYADIDGLAKELEKDWSGSFERGEWVPFIRSFQKRLDLIREKLHAMPDNRASGYLDAAAGDLLSWSSRVLQVTSDKDPTKLSRDEYRDFMATATEGIGRLRDRPQWRTWMSTDGKYTVEARLLQADEAFVRLDRRDGKVITVNRTQLSKADHAWLDSRK